MSEEEVLRTLAGDNPRKYKVKGILKRSEFTHPQSKDNDDALFEPQISSNHLNIVGQSLPQSANQSLVYDNKDAILISPYLQDQQESLSPLKSLFPSKVDSRQLWVHGGLKILFYITKFARQLKNTSQYSKFKQLSTSMVELISDAASDPDIFLQKEAYGQKLLDNIKWFFGQIPTLEPDSMIRLIWCFILVAMVLINSFYLPMKLGFELKMSISGSFILEQVPTWAFILDILVNMNTAFYSKGQIHRNKHDIVWHYLQSHLIFDLLVVVPYLLALLGVQYVEYVLLIRVTKVKILLEIIEEISNPNESIQAVIQLLKAVFVVIFMTHFCACLWGLIGELELNYGQHSWLVFMKIQDEEWVTKYITALYFSTITTLTVGYGDVVPQTNIERVFVTGMALFACGVLGYTISEIGNILKSFSEKREQFKQKMMHVNRYLKRKLPNKQLQLQVRKYFEFFFEMEQESNEQGEKWMQQLDKSLKEQVNIDIYEQMLWQSRIIRKVLSQTSVQKLCQCVHEKKFAPEEVIAESMQRADRMYFILSGEVSLTCNLYLTKVIKIQRKPRLLQSIAERRQVKENSSSKIIISTLSERPNLHKQLLYKCYDDFMRVLGEDPQEEEQFCQMRDALIFNEDQKNFGQICCICKWTHSFKKCPYVFFVANLNKIKNKFLINEHQERTFRARTKQRSTVTDRDKIREDAVITMVVQGLLSENELSDQFLHILGFKSLLASQFLKMSKSFSTLKSGADFQALKLNFENSPKDSSSSGSEIGSEIFDAKSLKQVGPKTDNRKVNFNNNVSSNNNLNSEEGEVVREQIGFQRKVQNRNTFKKVTLLLNQRFNNKPTDMPPIPLPAPSQTSNYTKTQSILENKEKSASTFNMLNHIHDDELVSMQPQYERVDFDIDKIFQSKYYFVVFNLNEIIQRFNYPVLKKVRKSKQYISQLLKKKL